MISMKMIVSTVFETYSFVIPKQLSNIFDVLRKQVGIYRVDLFKFLLEQAENYLFYLLVVLAAVSISTRNLFLKIYHCTKFF